MEGVFSGAFRGRSLGDEFWVLQGFVSKGRPPKKGHSGSQVRHSQDMVYIFKLTARVDQNHGQEFAGGYQHLFLLGLVLTLTEDISP